MATDSSDGNKSITGDPILDILLEDPTKSDQEIAEILKTYRQKIWRRKKQLEEKKVIWGYTSVIDEKKLNHISHIVLMKTKPMSQGLVDLLLERLTKEGPKKQNVRVLDFYYVNGEFDWLLRFSAPNHQTARKYYDTLRILYEDFLLEKPVMIDVNICLMSSGKRNPDIGMLVDYIPEPNP